MKRVRRLVLLVALIVCLINIVLLLNVTAPNPTGRRYSSEAPVTSGQGGSGEIGTDGERVLSKDLGVPRNDIAVERQCVCSTNIPGYTPSPNECLVCVGSGQLSTDTYRVPDFVTEAYIAESKNARSLTITSRDFMQISDMAIAAQNKGMPLWVYTRVNTAVDYQYYPIVEATGGRIVPYFTVPGYTDPVDQAAGTGLAAGGTVVGLMVMVEVVARRRGRGGDNGGGQPKPPRRPDPQTPLSSAEALLQRSREKARVIIDTEDSRRPDDR